MPNIVRKFILQKNSMELLAKYLIIQLITAAFVKQKNVRNLYIETRYIHLFFILICLFIMVQFVRGTGCSIRREIRDPIIYLTIGRLQG